MKTMMESPSVDWRRFGGGILGKFTETSPNNLGLLIPYPERSSLMDDLSQMNEAQLLSYVQSTGQPLPDVHLGRLSNPNLLSYFLMLHIPLPDELLARFSGTDLLSYANMSGKPLSPHLVKKLNATELMAYRIRFPA